jgi:hypothetical protein
LQFGKLGGATVLVSWPSAVAKSLSLSFRVEPVKPREAQEFLPPPFAERGLCKNKKPGKAGLLTNNIFVQFISSAWRSDARAAKPSGSHCCGE